MRRFSYLIAQSFFIIAVFLLPAISNLHAASISIDNPDPIDNPEINFELEPEPVNKELSNIINTKQTNPSSLLKKQTSEKIKEIQNVPSGDTFNSVTDLIEPPINLPQMIDKTQPQPYDFVNQGYEKLSEIIEDEVLDDSILIIKDINSELNQFNQEFDQKYSPLVEDIAILNQLQKLSTTDYSTKTNLYSNPESKNMFNGQTDNFSNEQTDDFSSGQTDNFSYRQSDDFLFQASAFLFNIENIITLLIIFLLLSGLVKILHFVLNRMY